MSQLDALAIPMASCFNDTPDLAPYTAVPNIIPLDLDGDEDHDDDDDE